jgi:DNA adenine methylase
VLNDADGDIVTYLRACQQHPQELARALRWQPASRRLFEKHLSQAPEALTDIQRAARFFYIQKNCWAGATRRPTFHFGVTKPTGYRPDTLPETFSEVARRLDRVQIEQGSYEQMLERYDRPSTVFYLDPPYVDLKLYRRNFSDEQFAGLADRLASLRGKFLLSINDCAKARRWFGRFNSRPLQVAYTATAKTKRVQELLFANFDLPAQTNERPPR